MDDLVSQIAAEELAIKDIPAILKRYPQSLPEALKELDVVRYETIPIALKERKAKGEAYLLKPEVETLVQWKIKHGKFRPTLPKLVASNTSNAIQETTRKAFKQYSSDPAAPEKAVKILNELKGIGPATSSLLLSVYDPHSSPFFSDEFFRYVFWNAPGTPNGWHRKLKYDMKELVSFYKEVEKIAQRVQEQCGESLKVVELEKVAFVLGKENAGVVAKNSAKGSKPDSSVDSKRKRDSDSKSTKPEKREKHQ